MKKSTFDVQKAEFDIDIRLLRETVNSLDGTYFIPVLARKKYVNSSESIGTSAKRSPSRRITRQKFLRMKKEREQ